MLFLPALRLVSSLVVREARVKGLEAGILIPQGRKNRASGATGLEGPPCRIRGGVGGILRANHPEELSA